MRYNSLSQPMEDYEIKDVINPYRAPIIELTFHLFYYRANSDPHYELYVIAKNIGNIMANHVHCILEILPRSLKDHRNDSSDKRYTFSISNIMNTTKHISMPIRPILSLMAWYLQLPYKGDINLHHLSKADDEKDILYTLSADNMQPKKDKIDI